MFQIPGTWWISFSGFQGLEKTKTDSGSIKKKFSKGNLDRIREAVQDGAKAYGLAAVFNESEMYPTEAERSQCLRATRSNSKVFLIKFKLWLDHSMRTSTAFKYRSRMFMFYGPLLKLFDLSTKHCWAKARETSYIL